MEHVVVRQAKSKDVREVAELFHCLWPKVSLAEHTQRNWLRCSPATSPELSRSPFSWPRTAAASLDLSRLIYARMPMDATLPVRPVTSRDGMLRLNADRDESEQNLSLQPRTGPASKVARRWPPTPGSIPKTPSVLTKRSGSRSWIAAYIIERIYKLGFQQYFKTSDAASATGRLHSARSRRPHRRW